MKGRRLTRGSPRPFSINQIFTEICYCGEPTTQLCCVIIWIHMENKTRNHWLGPNTENPIDYKLGNFRDDKPFQNIYRNHCTLVRKNKTAVGKSFVCVEGALSFESLSRFSDPFVAYCFWKESFFKKTNTILRNEAKFQNSPHLWPKRTGQAPWRVMGSGLPQRLRLYQKAAPPFTGFTATPARGNAVDPPRSTSLSYNRMTNE